MNYLIIGKKAYLRGFLGSVEDLPHFLSPEDLQTLLIEGVVQVVWGEYGEYWCYLSQLTAEVEPTNIEENTDEYLT